MIAVLFNIIVTIIEAIRIRLSWGKVSNVNKLVTWTIAILFYGVYLAIIYRDRYYTLDNPLEVVIDSLYYVLWRGALYDPLLNLLTGRKIDYVSETTNSIQDRIEKKLGITFWTQRLICLLFIILIIVLI